MYYTKVGRRNWIFFGVAANKKNKVTLFTLKGVSIMRHVLVQNRNPFLAENREYFEKRSSYGTFIAGFWTWKQKKVLKKTGGKCLVCGETLSVYENIELHHILPKKLGGEDKI